MRIQEKKSKKHDLTYQLYGLKLQIIKIYIKKEKVYQKNKI